MESSNKSPEFTLIDHSLLYSAEPDYRNFDIRMSNLISEAVVLQLTFLLVDHFRKEIRLVSHNPQINKLILQQGVSMVDELYVSSLIPDHRRPIANCMVNTVKQINSGKIIKNDLYYFLSADFPLVGKSQSEHWISIRIIPYKFSNTQKTGIPWMTYYLLKSVHPAGQISFNAKWIKRNETYNFLTETPCRTDAILPFVTDFELGLFRMTADGFTESEIAASYQLSIGSFKVLKNNALERIKVRSMNEAIMALYKNNLLQK
jgi:DNA-binding CsgD family transcriptional regulator